MPTPSQMTFGDLLRRHRAAAGLTQEELAEQAGLSVEAISALERGTRHTPRKETVQLLAEALALPDDDHAKLLAARRRPPAETDAALGATRILRVAEPSGGLAASVQTFLVAGIPRYAQLAQGRGEAVAQAAARLMAGAREIVGAQGGRMLEGPEGRPDVVRASFASPRQALFAAILLRRRSAQERASHPELLPPIGIGLDAGEALTPDGSTPGGAIWLAARLAALAGRGEVLASEGVAHLARRIPGVVYVERGPAQLKGLDDPVRVVQVLPESAQTAARPATLTTLGAALGAALGTPDPRASSPTAVVEPPIDLPLPLGGFLGALPDGPLVARAAEAGEIRAALDAVAGGAGRLLLLGGEPGVGKTRLAQEATREARDRGFLLATGRCYEPQQSVPFFPFREALAAAYAAAPVAVRDEAPEKWPGVLRLLPGEGAASPAPEAPEEGGQLGGQEERQRLFWHVTGFLRALADLRPVALLLDDLQWADASSVALLAHLARQTRASRILLLGAYRDDEVTRGHPLEAALRDLGRERLVTRLAVKRLPAEGTAALIRDVVGAGEGVDDVAPELVALVHRGTEGNPLFTREVVRALVERGDVERRDGRWEPRAGVAIAVPEGVRAVIAQRLARLSPTAREVTQDASVLGQTFTFDDLQALRDRPEVEVEAALDAAQAAGLIRETGGDGYTFQHGLIQGAIYADLTSRRRQRTHRAAADTLKRRPERDRNRRAAELAWHLLEGGLPDEALPYTLRAGDAAEAVFAHREAEQRYKQALELARELGERGREAEAQTKLGALYMTVGRYDEALEALDRAAEAARLAGDREGRRRAVALIGRVHARRGAAKQGVERVQPLLQTMTEGTASPGLAALHIALADLYYTSGRYKEQLAAAERAADLARTLGDEALLAQAEQWRSGALLALGRAEEALPALQEVIPRAEAAGDLSGHAHALSQVALAYIQRGELEEGRAYIERALAVAERRGDPAQTAFMAYNRGMLAVHLGDWKRARADYDRAASIMDSVGMAWTAAYPLLGLGHLALLEGRWEEASRLLQKAIAQAERNGDAQALRLAQIPLIERDLLEGRPEVARARLDRLLDPRASGRFEGFAGLLALAAWLRLELGEDARAEALVAQATARAAAEANRLAEVEALRVAADVAARGNQWPAAGERAERALALARAMPCPHQLARALYTTGAVLARKGEREPARVRLSEALGILAGLGERLYAQRVEALLAELGPA